MIARLLILILAGSAVSAETIVAARTIPAHTILTFEDLTVVNSNEPGGVADPFQLVGKESRVALYAGRPVRVGDVTAPAIIERNQRVNLIFDNGALKIRANGRALDRGGVGDVIMVMNLESRLTVAAEIRSDGSTYVGIE